MADTKISALSAAASAALANEFAINEAGTSKKISGTQLSTLLQTDNTISVNYTLAAAKSCVVNREMTINTGIKFTVNSGAYLRIL